MEKAGAVERVAGGLTGQILTQGVASAVASGAEIAGLYYGLPPGAIGGLANCIPVMLQSLAATRGQERLGKAIEQINADITSLAIDVTQLTDEQYKVAAEVFAALTQTLDQQKIDQLHSIFLGTLRTADLQRNDAYVLPRVVRDISALEFAFLVEYGEARVPLAFLADLKEKVGNSADFNGEYALIKGDEDEAREVVNGLISLGLLIRHISWNPSYSLTPLATKLIGLAEAGAGVSHPAP